MTEEEKNSWQKWYDENKTEYNKKRAQRYANDPEYREKVRGRAKLYYWTKRRKPKDATAQEREDVELTSSVELKVTIKNPDDVRYGETITVPGYTTGQIGKLLNRTAQTVRLWIKRGILPEATYRSESGPRYRYYTEDQMKVIKANRHLLNLPTKDLEEGPFVRAVREGWKQIPDGVAVRRYYVYEGMTGLAEIAPGDETVEFTPLGDDVSIEVPVDALEPLS